MAWAPAYFSTYLATHQSQPIFRDYHAAGNIIYSECTLPLAQGEVNRRAEKKIRRLRHGMITYNSIIY
ncbi:MAG TPA: hypothetical protein VGV68_03055 [Terriglobia bacterium]|nr:hypothetical protein [Terriglobia bacterium]